MTATGMLQDQRILGIELSASVAGIKDRVYFHLSSTASR